MSTVTEPSAAELAALVRERAGHDPNKLREVTGLLLDAIGGDDLRRIADLWDLSVAEVGRMFGVSRQAVSRWFDRVPSDRAEQVARLAGATDRLVRYVKPDRIPAVVRRRPGGEPSLVDLASEGRFDEVYDQVRAAFDLRSVQP